MFEEDKQLEHVDVIRALFFNKALDLTEVTLRCYIVVVVSSLLLHN